MHVRSYLTLLPHLLDDPSVISVLSETFVASVALIADEDTRKYVGPGCGPCSTSPGFGPPLLYILADEPKIYSLIRYLVNSVPHLLIRPAWVVDGLTLVEPVLQDMLDRA